MPLIDIYMYSVYCITVNIGDENKSENQYDV